MRKRKTPRREERKKVGSLKSSTRVRWKTKQADEPWCWGSGEQDREGPDGGHRHRTSDNSGHETHVEGSITGKSFQNRFGAEGVQ